ncbi:MAG TPA: STAS domain-containing protein [Xanthomonadales bacterium]|nr:STAS domain-containing protein [Xanthomonadales bacterium]
MVSSASIQIGSGGRSGDTASLSGDLTFSTVRDLSVQGEVLLADNSPVKKLDLQDVTRVDSSGLALLLEWQSRARAQGAGLKVLNAPEDLARLARLCEAESLLQLNNNETQETAS